MIDMIRFIISNKSPNFILTRDTRFVKSYLESRFQLNVTGVEGVRSELNHGKYKLQYHNYRSAAYSGKERDEWVSKFDSVGFCVFPGPTVRHDADWIETKFHTKFHFLNGVLVQIIVDQVGGKAIPD